MGSTCYSNCPAGMVEASEDMTQCIPAGPTCSSYSATISDNFYVLAQDPVFSIVCNKAGLIKNISCPAGTTEWRSGYCYIDCPVGMVENGLSCLRRTIRRLEVNPECKNWLFWFDGTSCVPNPFSFLVIVGTFAIFIYLCTREKF